MKKDRSDFFIGNVELAEKERGKKDAGSFLNHPGTCIWNITP